MQELIKEFKMPPLAFNRNKKNMLKNFREVLREDMRSYINEKTIFYDIFGGSGLLAHETKRLYPKNRVVWNDFDNFQARLDIAEDTERLRAKISEVVGKDTTQRLSEEQKKKVKELLEKELEQKGKFDYIQLSSYLLFGGSYAKDERALLKKGFYYNRLAYGKIDTKGYLKGVERVQKDYKELIKEAILGENFFLILDPPYISTEKAHYENFFGLREFLELMTLIKMPFVFFSSAKSEILPLIDFCNDEQNLQNLQNLHFKRASLANGNAKNKDDFIFYKDEARLF